jgi:hypothetical protein
MTQKDPKQKKDSKPSKQGAAAEAQQRRTSSGGFARPTGVGIAIDSNKIGVMTDVQKSQQNSAFNSWTGQRKRAAFLGADPSQANAEALSGPIPVPDYTPDGKSPAPGVDLREAWKASQAPIQSRPGSRSKGLYQSVIDQFAIASNVRYDDDGPGKPRGHIFVWDVSRAMGCEIPHFAGPKELSLAQTVDWVRHEAVARGWLKVANASIFAAAENGLMVVAVPREARERHIALVAPQTPDLKPLLTGSALKRGHLVSVRDMFGIQAIDCFYHP